MAPRVSRARAGLHDGSIYGTRAPAMWRASRRGVGGHFLLYQCAVRPRRAGGN